MSDIVWVPMIDQSTGKTEWFPSAKSKLDALKSKPEYYAEPNQGLNDIVHEVLG